MKKIELSVEYFKATYIPILGKTYLRYEWFGLKKQITRRVVSLDEE
jgi:hypothetical protein